MAIQYLNNETIVILTMDLLLNALNDASCYSSRLTTKIQYYYSIFGSHHTLVATELSTDIMERRGWGLKITSKFLVHISGKSLWTFGSVSSFQISFHSGEDNFWWEIWPFPSEIVNVCDEYLS